jgi:hypothetical protein
MPELGLTSEQKAKLTAYIPAYLNWLTSPEGETDVKEHRDHERARITGMVLNISVFSSKN